MLYLVCYFIILKLASKDEDLCDYFFQPIIQFDLLIESSHSMECNPKIINLFLLVFVKNISPEPLKDFEVKNSHIIQVVTKNIDASIDIQVFVKDYRCVISPFLKLIATAYWYKIPLLFCCIKNPYISQALTSFFVIYLCYLSSKH